MKRLFSFAACLVAAIFFVKADGETSPQERYIKKFSGIAVSEMQRTGVPASITLAQGMLESGYGLSTLAVQGHNHFGIKCHSSWKGKKLFHDDDQSKECFRAYPTDAQSFKDHSDFLRYWDRYKFLFELDPTDYKAWAHGLKKAGYATDPAYAGKLIKLIEDYKLFRFDSEPSTGETISVPETPLQAEKQSESSIEASEHYSYSLVRQQYRRNGVRFVYAQEGETFASIAADNKLFLKEILRFNEVSAEATLTPGSPVYLQRKKKYAASGIEMYVFSEGETLHSVCQRFAIQQKSILKLNDLPEGYQPSEGDKIILRKVR